MQEPETLKNTPDGGQLRAFVERIERVNVERDALAQDLSEIFKEARGTGFNVKVMKKVVALRRKDRQPRIEEETVLELYLNAIGE